jgi:ribose-phosphate pyrophosphokinase
MLYVDNQPVTIEVFPNNESRIKASQPALNGSALVPTIRLAYESDTDLIALLFVTRHLDRPCALELDYVPYSRNDRASAEVFTLKYVADFINALGFTSVTIQEPHSDVAPALLNRSISQFPAATWLLEAAMAAIGADSARDALLIPDAGAAKRYGTASPLDTVLVGMKHRDHGILSGTALVGPSLAPDARVIIIDDLCSYGNTFKNLATVLLERDGPHPIYLVVAHLEPAVYLGGLLDSGLIEHVFATNSLQSESLHPRVTLFDPRSHQVIQSTNEGEK